MSKVKEKLTETTKEEAPAGQANDTKGEIKENKTPSTIAKEKTEASSANKHTDNKKEETAKPAPHKPRSHAKKSSGNVVAFAGLVVACGAFGAGYLAWQELGEQQAALDQQLQQVVQTAQSSSSFASNAQSTSQSLQQQVGELSTRINQEVGQLKQNAADVDKTLSAINDRITEKTPNDWLIAEAKHLINIANHQAQLNHNIAATISALETADQRLRDVGDPSLTKVRQAITADLVKLKSIPQIDTTGVSLTLNQLENNVGQLPLLNEYDQAPTTEAPTEEVEVSGVQSFFEKVWADIKSLVSIRRTEDEFNSALLPPDQRFFLRQNLRLKLETARLALLQQDTPTFRASIKTTQQWLKQYFDTSTTANINLLATLAEYEKLELSPELPDLSNTIRMLETWQKQQRRAS